MSEASINHLATYYPHYKKKLINNPGRIFVCAVNYLHLLYSLGNLSIASFLAHNTDIYAIKLGLVIKKEKRSKTVLDLSHFIQHASLFFSLTLSNISSEILEYAAIYKYVAILEWQY